MRVSIPLIGGLYESQSLPLSAQMCINWYPHIPRGGALSEGALFGCPGTTQLATAGADATTACRGAHVMNGIPYFVQGTTLYALNRGTAGDGTTTYTLEDLGTITGSGRVSMADNGTQLVVQVPGGSGYVYNGTTLAEITDSDFTANGNPQYVTFIDGYFVFSTDSKRFIASDVSDGTSYDPLFFASAEADPDDIVAPFVFNNQLIMFGSETHEIYQNIGGTDFPFQRIPGAVVDVGLVAPLSLQKIRGGYMFLGAGEDEDPAIFFSTGARPERVSTEPIDNAIQNLSREDIVACHSWSYGKDGHYFVGFSFPQLTIVYDVSTGLWHERKSVVSGSQAASRVESTVQAYGITLCGDSYDGRIGSIDNDVYTEYGERITRERVSQPISNQLENIFIPEMEVVVESGRGEGDLEFRFSRNARTWSDWIVRGMGSTGNYDQRLVWRRLGKFPRFALFHLRTSTDRNPNILSMVADIG